MFGPLVKRLITFISKISNPVHRFLMQKKLLVPNGTSNMTILQSIRHKAQYNVQGGGSGVAWAAMRNFYLYVAQVDSNYFDWFLFIELRVPAA